MAVYYFAADEEVFVRLGDELKAIYSAGEESRPTPIRVGHNDALKPALLHCGLPTTQRRIAPVYDLRKYRFLTHLNNAQLSAYLQIPLFGSDNRILDG